MHHESQLGGQYLVYEGSKSTGFGEALDEMGKHLGMRSMRVSSWTISQHVPRKFPCQFPLGPFVSGGSLWRRCRYRRQKPLLRRRRLQNHGAFAKTNESSHQTFCKETSSLKNIQVGGLRAESQKGSSVVQSGSILTETLLPNCNPNLQSCNPVL